MLTYFKHLKRKRQGFKEFVVTVIIDAKELSNFVCFYKPNTFAKFQVPLKYRPNFEIGPNLKLFLLNSFEGTRPSWLGIDENKL